MANDAVWCEWSSQALEQAADQYRLVINPVVYAEVSIRYSRIEDLDAALPKTMFYREPIRTKRLFSPASRSCSIAAAADRGDRPFPISLSAPTPPLPAIF